MFISNPDKPLWKRIGLADAARRDLAFVNKIVLWRRTQAGRVLDANGNGSRPARFFE